MVWNNNDENRQRKYTIQCRSNQKHSKVKPSHLSTAFDCWIWSDRCTHSLGYHIGGNPLITNKSKLKKTSIFYCVSVFQCCCSCPDEIKVTEETCAIQNKQKRKVGCPWAKDTHNILGWNFPVHRIFKLVFMRKGACIRPCVPSKPNIFTKLVHLTAYES